LKKETSDKILNHYTKLYRKFGINPASLGWPKGKQNVRFSAMSKIGDLQNSRVLDVGCGFGDLLTYFKLRKIHVDYTGIDINSEFINIAKQKHPDTTFAVRDIETRKFKKKIDWVFGIGLTNKGGSYNYIENLLEEMCRIAKKGVTMDFLSSYVDFKRKGDFHASPEQIFKIAKKFSKRVVIKHDYLPWQFCVFVYTNDKLNKDNMFNDFELQK